jgi:hypothetical protein
LYAPPEHPKQQTKPRSQTLFKSSENQSIPQKLSRIGDWGGSVLDAIQQKWLKKG